MAKDSIRIYWAKYSKILGVAGICLSILLAIPIWLWSHLCGQVACYAEPFLGRCSLDQFNALSSALNTLFTALIAGIAGLYTLWAGKRASEEKAAEKASAENEREIDKNNMVDRKIAEYTRQLLEFNTIQIEYPEIMQVFRDEHSRYDERGRAFLKNFPIPEKWDDLSARKARYRRCAKKIFFPSDFFNWPRALNLEEREGQLLKTRAKSYIYKRMNFFDELISLANPESTESESDAIRKKMEFKDWETFIRVRMSNPLYLEVWLGESAIFGEKFNAWMDRNLFKIIEHTGDPKYRYVY